jgi:hypothetical protein
MQAAHSTRRAAASSPVAVVELPLPALVLVRGAAVFVVAMVATDGDLDPPHAARAITIGAMRRAGQRARWCLVDLANLICNSSRGVSTAA